ncbi:hypothetical protein CSUI_006004, partial [Cystoisospora suis]
AVRSRGRAAASPGSVAGWVGVVVFAPLLGLVLCCSRGDCCLCSFLF